MPEAAKRPRRILLLQMGSWSHINSALANALEQRLNDWEVVVVDLLAHIREDPFSMLLLAADLPVLTWWAVRDRFFNPQAILYAPTFARVLRRLTRRLVAQYQPTFTIQTTTRFSGGDNGVPHFTIIDNTLEASREDSAIFNASSRFSLASYDAFQRKVFHHSDAVFALGSYVRETLVSHYGLPSERAVTIGAGPNIALGPRSCPLQTKKILFVGTNWERKGGPTLLAAFCSIRDSHPDATLEIIGCAPDITEAGVHVLGRLPRSDLHRHFTSARLFVLPTLYEPFGIVFVEALHFGLPIVATNVGAISEMVSDGINGYTIVPNDAKGLAQALSRLLNDDAIAVSFGEASYRRAAMFTWERSADIICQTMSRLTGECC